MRLIVKSRRLAEQSNGLKEPHIIISIRNPGSKVPDLATNENTKGTLFFEFDDLDRMPKEGSATYEALGKPILFQPEMAQKVIKKLKDTEVQAVIVHCEAGVSRSAGLAAALSNHFNEDDTEYFSGAATMYAPNVYCPNYHVYRVMLEALNEG